MESKPKLLDLFCGAGGAAMGYSRTGFEVVGVDNRPQKHYPFEFHQADAFDYLRDHGHEFAVIHASPPCQAYSIMRNLPWLRDRQYPRLIDPVREALREIGIPYIIENVMGAKLDAGRLCGGMFGLPFYRHRAFETNFFWLQPNHPGHKFTVRNGRTMGSRARDIVHNGAKKLASNYGHAAGVSLAREAMGIPWMSREEITQAIPPAYTEWIGKQLLKALNQREAQRPRPPASVADKVSNEPQQEIHSAIQR